MLVTITMMTNMPCLGAQPYPELNEPAVQALAPAQAMLIGIARAGDRLVAVGVHGLIIYSDDNGLKWAQASDPVSVTLTSVDFIDAQDGWAAGAFGVVLHTIDGGMTWKLQLDGLKVNQLMSSAAQQFLLANPTLASARTAVRRADILNAAGPDKPFLSVLALTAQRVFVFGGYRLCVKTADAGMHWADCSLQVPDPTSHNLYSAIQAGSEIYIAGEAGDIFRSDDGGTTFLALPAPSASTVFGILMTGRQALLAYGVAGELFRSVNGGQSWQSVSLPIASDLTGGIVLPSGEIVIVNESGSVFISNDDGASFTMLSEAVGMVTNGIIQAANGDAVLIGSSGIRVLPESALNAAG